MMLDYLGENEASDRIIKSIEKTLSDKKSRTKDLTNLVGYVKGQPYYGPFHEHEGRKMVCAKHTPFPHAFIDPDPKSNKILVASSSLPFAGVTKLNPKTQKFTFSGTYNLNDETIKISDQVDHNYFTGDAVYYTPEKTKVTNTLPDGTVVVQEFISSQIFDEGLHEYIQNFLLLNAELARQVEVDYRFYR